MSIATETPSLGVALVRDAARLEQVRALLARLTSGVVDVELRLTGGPETNALFAWRPSSCSMSPSLRNLWRFRPERAVVEVAELEAFWQDGPALLITSPGLALQFSYGQEYLRGSTWVLRRR
jgi:hypothetical protein